MHIYSPKDTQKNTDNITTVISVEKSNESKVIFINKISFDILNKIKYSILYGNEKEIFIIK